MVGPLFPDYNLGIDGYTDMAATMERLEEYRTHNTQFCKRMLDFFTVMFPAQVSSLLENTDGISTRDGKPEIVAHAELESYLGRYCGLMLYLKEMDEVKYSKVCAVRPCFPIKDVPAGYPYLVGIGLLLDYE